MKLFDVNHYVTGKYFIGRKNEIEFFQKNFFDEVVRGNSRYYSLTGMNRIGKTSLIKELCARFCAESHPDVYLIDTSLDGKHGFWQYWIFSILLPLTKQIKFDQISQELQEDIKVCCDYFNNRETWNLLFSDDPIADLEAKDQLELLFQLLRYAEKQTIIIIDEFDKAGQIFGTREENFGWFRGLLQQELGISVITLSRRSIYYIEYNNFGGSTLHGIFTKRSLFGFSNSEIDEYFRRVEETYGALTPTQKKAIWYYCGRSPQYLAIMGDAIVNAESPNQIDVSRISASFYDYFDAIIHLLKEEKLLTAMLQMFVGPKYNLKRSDVDKLVAMGYCMTKAALDAQFESKEYADYFLPEDASAYLTVSDYFVDYLSDVHQTELENIWPKLTHTEKKLRKIIEIEYTDMYAESWKEVLKRIALKNGESDFHTGYLQKHESRYLTASAEKQQMIGNSILNVISLSSLGYIIRANWDDRFKRYFRVSRKAFTDGIYAMYNARNPISHSNGDLLSDAEIADVEDICNEFISSIDSVLCLTGGK